MPVHSSLAGASARSMRQQRDAAALDGVSIESALRRAAIINATLVKLGALKLEELDVTGFHAMIDGVIAALEQARSTAAVQIAERRLAEETHRFLRQQEDAFRSREEEFSNTVAMLTDAVAHFRDSSSTFTDDVIGRGERIRRLSHIDDIRALRERLEQEVDGLREAALTRQQEDAAQLAALRGRVQVLESKLALATVSANRDGLTGLFNRAAWEGRMVELGQQLHVGDHDYAIAFIDLDQFKAINDTYGHSAGDAVLQTFADLCRQAFGADDFIARFGGDEFAVLLTARNQADAIDHVEALLAGVRGANAQPAGKRIAFTLSIGIAMARPFDTAPLLFDRADRALYAAKQAGRDRMVIAA